MYSQYHEVYIVLSVWVFLIYVPESVTKLNTATLTGRRRNIGPTTGHISKRFSPIRTV